MRCCFCCTKANLTIAFTKIKENTIPLRLFGAREDAQRTILILWQDVWNKTVILNLATNPSLYCCLQPLRQSLHLTVLSLGGNLRAVALRAALASLAALGGDRGVGLQLLGVFGSR